MATRILIIDDEIDICEMLKDILSEVVDDIVTVQSAPAALKVLDEQEFHLIISDIKMPDMTGMELLKCLHKKMYSNPVVFISASDEDEVLSEALSYGAADFVPKPFEAEEVLALVKKLIAVANILQKSSSSNLEKKRIA